jgi:hypothetical protein
MSRPGVSELQSEYPPISGAKWPPCEEQHCPKETRFLSKASDLSAHVHNQHPTISEGCLENLILRQATSMLRRVTTYQHQRKTTED